MSVYPKANLKLKRLQIARNTTIFQYLNVSKFKSKSLVKELIGK